MKHEQPTTKEEDNRLLRLVNAYLKEHDSEILLRFYASTKGRSRAARKRGQSRAMIRHVRTQWERRAAGGHYNRAFGRRNADALAIDFGEDYVDAASILHGLAWYAAAAIGRTRLAKRGFADRVFRHVARGPLPADFPLTDERERMVAADYLEMEGEDLHARLILSPLYAAAEARR